MPSLKAVAIDRRSEVRYTAHALLSRTKKKRIFRWVGAKGHVVPLLAPFLARELRANGGRLVSLFYGAGLLEQAVTNVAPQLAAEANPDLRCLYSELARDPDAVFDALVELDSRTPRSREGFNALRAHVPRLACARASRFLWLSTMSFNGLWRVNRKGEHNVPPDPARLAHRWPFPNRAQFATSAEQVRRVRFYADWQSAAKLVRPGDLVISDPPYLGGFDAYTAAGFQRRDHESLAARLQHLAVNGCVIVAFNSPAAAPLYSSWARLHWVHRSGRMNCRPQARGRVREFVAFAPGPESISGGSVQRSSKSSGPRSIFESSFDAP